MSSENFYREVSSFSTLFGSVLPQVTIQFIKKWMRFYSFHTVPYEWVNSVEFRKEVNCGPVKAAYPAFPSTVLQTTMSAWTFRHYAESRIMPSSRPWLAPTA